MLAQVHKSWVPGSRGDYVGSQYEKLLATVFTPRLSRWHLEF